MDWAGAGALCSSIRVGAAQVTVRASGVSRQQQDAEVRHWCATLLNQKRDTEDCFLQVQLIEANVRVTEMPRCLPRSI